MMNKVNILIFSCHYLKNMGLSSGSDVTPIQDIKQWLKIVGDDKISICVVTSKEGLRLYSYLLKDIARKIRFTCVFSIGTKSMALEYFMRTIGSFIFSLRYNVKNVDVIRSCSEWGLFDILPSFILKLRKRRAIWMASFWHFIPPPLSRPGNFVSSFLGFLNQRIGLKLISFLADVVVTETKVNKAELVKLGLKHDKVLVARGAFDSEAIATAKPSSRTYDFCFIGRIFPTKGIFDLIKAFKFVQTRLGRCTLVMIGSGPKIWENRLRMELKKHNLTESVYLMGSVPEEEKYSILKASKVFVLPSYEEGLPIVVCEAMACGVPVIAYDLPTYKDGWMTLPFVKVRLGDVEMLAEKMYTLLKDDLERAKFIVPFEKVKIYDHSSRAYAIWQAIIRELHKCYKI
jgi:glycosyltransferase involved in cell wall biosynthesis